MDERVAQTLGHYRLLEVLGEGGMGRVYLAEDSRLGRRVALKLLPPEMHAQPERLARFEREARAVASLNHPNIVTIHSIEEAGGQRFLTMERVEGETLDRVIPPDGLPVERFFPLATSLADALAAAHQQGITHRDLKPQNVMVSREGRLKVLDFGLAKLREGEGGAALDTEGRTTSVTQDGRILGTVAYMSPEQAQGLPVDHRSDIFSLAILLYEMATGQRPFRGETNISVLSAILKDLPPPVTELKPGLPRPLARMIARGMARDPNDRYQSALDLKRDLEDLKRDLDTGELIASQFSQPGMRVTPRRGSRRPALAIGAAALLLLLGLAGYALLGRDPAAPAAAEEAVDTRPSLAVFYFDNMAGDEELDWLRTGLTDMLVTDLSQSPNLRVLGTARLYQMLEELGRVDGQTSLEVVQSVARDANVSRALVGSFARAGDRIRINAQLQDPATGEVLASESVEGEGEDALFGMVDDLTDRIRLRFELPRAAEVDRELREVTTSSLKAYRAYVEGFRLHEQLREREARPHFEEALEHDPRFAMAMAKLAVVHHNLGDRAAALRYSSRALELVEHLSGRERYYIEGFHYSLTPETRERSLAAYRRAVSAYPDHASARNNLAMQLVEIGRYEEALRHLEYLRQRGMPFPGTYGTMAQAYVQLGRVPQALDVLEEYARRNPSNETARVYLAEFLGGLGRFEEAFAELESVADTADVIAARFRLSLLRGDRSGAAKRVAELEAADAPGARGKALVAEALLLAYEGRVDAALARLHQALDEPEARKEQLTAFRIATFNHDAGRYERALAALDAALGEGSLHPYERFFSHMLRAVCQARLGEARAADATFVDAERVLEFVPDARREMLRATMSGLVALASGDAERAVHHLEAAAGEIRPDPMGYDGQPVYVWYALGAAHEKLGDPAGAARWFQRVVDAGSQRLYAPIVWVRSHERLARIQARLGDREEARRCYARYLDYWGGGEVERERVAAARRSLEKLGGAPSGSD